jgi:hypothetical protein
LGYTQVVTMDRIDPGWSQRPANIEKVQFLDNKYTIRKEIILRLNAEEANWH